MLLHNDQVCDPCWEDWLSKNPCFGKFGDLYIDCFVPISPLNPFLLSDILCSWFNVQVLLYYPSTHPTIFVGFHANTCLYFLRSSNSASLMVGGRLTPIRMDWSGYFLFKTSILFGFSDDGLLVPLVMSAGWMI